MKAHRILFSALGVAALAALATLGPVGLIVAAPVAAYGLVLLGNAPMPSQRMPRWADVSVYRVLSFARSMRDKAGEMFLAGMFRTGAALRAFPGSVTSDLAFGIVGECAFDGPFRSQPARIDHATAANIVVGRWFTLAADGTARPGGAGALAGILIHPKNYSNGGSGGDALAAGLTLVTGTVGEFGYMGQFIVAAPAAVALGDAAKYNTTTGVIGVGAPGAGEAAIPNSRFVRVINAAAGLAVLELTN